MVCVPCDREICKHWSYCGSRTELQQQIIALKKQIEKFEYNNDSLCASFKTVSAENDKVGKINEKLNKKVNDLQELMGYLKKYEGRYEIISCSDQNETTVSIYYEGFGPVMSEKGTGIEVLLKCFRKAEKELDDWKV